METMAASMALAIQYRGPDDAGAWADVQAGIALNDEYASRCIIYAAAIISGVCPFA